MRNLSLRAAIRRQDNDYDAALRRFERHAGQPWQTPGTGHAVGRAMSVVLPAFDVAHAIIPVLDALHDAWTVSPFEVIVVDDASRDATRRLALEHPLPVTIVALPVRFGSAVARNLGTAVAAGDNILYLDADMVVGSQVIADLRARVDDGLVVLGFRHNTPYLPSSDPTRPLLPTTPPSLDQDHRVRWRAQPCRLLYSGMLLTEPVDVRPLDATDDLRALGHGAWFYDWDLPRMVVTATLAVPRAAVVAVGGFHPGFATGWGAEDTHLGAKLIATGHKVIPARQAVGYHIDPPDAERAWQRKLASWPHNQARYWRLLDAPLPRDGARYLAKHTSRLLADCEVTSQ